MAGVILGGIVGAVAGILMAPASGEETRTRIADKGKEYKDAAKDKALEKSQETISYAKDKVQNLKGHFSNNPSVQEALDKVEQSLSGKGE